MWHTLREIGMNFYLILMCPKWILLLFWYRKEKLIELEIFYNFLQALKQWWTTVVLRPTSENMLNRMLYGFGHGLLSRCAAAQKRLATTALMRWSSTSDVQHRTRWELSTSCKI
jgi:hypothetical protein